MVTFLESFPNISTVALPKQLRDVPRIPLQHLIDRLHYKQNVDMKSSSWPISGRVAQSVGHPTHKSGVLGSIPGLATYFRFSFRFFKKGSCQLLAKVCARSTG